jgi:hypothetical protein
MKIKNITTLDALITEYPQLKLTITGVLPEFGNLEQPQLREKVLATTTVEHLARKAGMEVFDLIRDLEQAAGLSTAEEGLSSDTLEYAPADPDWIKVDPKHRIDGVEMLSRGEHPLSIIKASLEEMKPDQVILLTTNFHPNPMIEAMIETGAEVFSRKDINEDTLFLTFIKK